MYRFHCAFVLQSYLFKDVVAARKVFQSQMQHVIKGCLTDPLHLPPTYELADGKIRYIRGTSPLEVFHRYLKDCTSSHGEYMGQHCQIVTFAYNWNISRMCARDATYERFPEWWILSDIHILQVLLDIPAEKRKYQYAVVSPQEELICSLSKEPRSGKERQHRCKRDQHIRLHVCTCVHVCACVCMCMHMHVCMCPYCCL